MLRGGLWGPQARRGKASCNRRHCRPNACCRWRRWQWRRGPALLHTRGERGAEICRTTETLKTAIPRSPRPPPYIGMHSQLEWVNSCQGTRAQASRGLRAAGGGDHHGTHPGPATARRPGPSTSCRFLTSRMTQAGGEGRRPKAAYREAACPGARGLYPGPLSGAFIRKDPGKARLACAPPRPWAIPP